MTARVPTSAPSQRGTGLAAAALLAGLVGAATLAATAQIWRDADANRRRDEREELEFRARDAETRLIQRMRAYEQVLRGAGGLFAASEEVTRDEFRAYFVPLQLADTYPGIQALGYAPRVPASALADHLAEVRREGFPGYAVQPGGDRPVYGPVVYLEPFSDRNMRAFGFDMLAEPVRRAAMERARDGGRPILSGKVKLVEETGQDVQAGALLFLPVYRNGAATGTLEERQAALAGWIYGSFRMRDLMVGTFGPRSEDLDFHLFDGDSLEPTDLLFDSDDRLEGAAMAGGELGSRRLLEISGHRWTMVVDPKPSPEARHGQDRPLLVALTGSAASAVLTLLVWLLASGRVRAQGAARRLELTLAQRRRAEEEVKAAQRFAQATLDAMPEEICVLDESGTVVSVNRAWRDFAEANGGRPEAVSEGCRYLEACRNTGSAGADGPAFAARLEQVLSGTLDRFSLEYDCHSPSQHRWFLARASRFEDGGRVRVVVAHQDISDLKAAERLLRESEARLRLAIASSSQVEWDHDVVSGAMTFGSGWRALTGLEPGANTTLPGWRAKVHPDDVDAALARLEACRQGRAEAFEADYRLADAAGQWRWFRSRGRVTSRDAAGRPLTIVGTVTDIDEVHALQERLLAATRLASVGTLAAGVAHEINNPLAWIHGNLEVAEEKLAKVEAADWPGVAAEVLALVRESVLGTTRIADIVKAMRSLGRPERAEESRPIDVGAELQRVVHMVRNQLQQRAQLVVDVPAGLPPVQGRTSELGRVFLNLLLNAVQAIPEGRPEGHRIVVSARHTSAGLVVEVRDSGTGIAPEVMERLFDPFFTTKPVGQGTGLGLSIARSIVDAAGGRIEVESAPGQGSTFRVHLPTAAAPAAPASAPTAPRPTSGRHRVLLVDDEPAVARAVSRRLEPRHEVTVLATAQEALRRLDGGERWDALLIDLMMPGTDGITFHERLAESHPELLRRLAFLSGGAFGDRATRFLAEHDVPLVTKPVLIEELLEVIDRLAAEPR